MDIAIGKILLQENGEWITEKGNRVQSINFTLEIQNQKVEGTSNFQIQSYYWT